MSGEPLSEKVKALNLVDYAAAAAQMLLDKYPNIQFNSGRRDSVAQARAMAPNIAQNRQWVAQTYMANPQSQALQAWVDAHPAAGVAEIQAGLLSIMNGWTDAQKGTLSRHFSGQAFDIQPVPGPNGDAIKAFIQTLPGKRKFFDKEGGKVIWHVDFDKPA